MTAPVNPVALESIRRWIETADRVVVLTGAGISTDSGIPDFRGPQGVWTRNPIAEKQSSIDHYLADPEVRRASWQSRLEHAAWHAKPNPGHLALVALERRDKLHALITQNFDGLHQRSGSARELVIEVHGTMREVMCWSCKRTGPMEPVLDRVRGGEVDPPCEVCGGILKSNTISFGQALVPEVIDRAMRAASEAEVFVSIGTSLQVYPIANTVALAKRNRAKVIIINAQETPLDDLADVVLRAPISAVLPAIFGAD